MPTYVQHYLSLKKKKVNSNHLPSLEKLKREYINYLLKVTENRINETAEILNIPHASLCQKLNKYGLLKNQSLHN